MRPLHRNTLYLGGDKSEVPRGQRPRRPAPHAFRLPRVLWGSEESNPGRLLTGIELLSIGLFVLTACSAGIENNKRQAIPFTSAAT